jgi:hypothetical protein
MSWVAFKKLHGMTAPSLAELRASRRRSASLPGRCGSRRGRSRGPCGPQGGSTRGARGSPPRSEAPGRLEERVVPKAPASEGGSARKSSRRAHEGWGLLRCLRRCGVSEGVPSRAQGRKTSYPDCFHASRGIEKWQIPNGSRKST